MWAMSDSFDGQGPPPLLVALCADTDALERFGGLLRHLVVGLVDQAVRLQLISADERVESLCLGPVRAFVHRPLAWPVAGRRIKQLVDELSAQPPTIVHAFSSGSYALARELADAFDADVVCTVTSLVDCKSLARAGLHRVQRIFAMSRPLESVVIEQLRAPVERVSLIRPGVLAQERAACFAQPGRVPAILSTSPLERRSGVDHLIEAIDLLRQRGHELMLFLLGRGRCEDAIRRQIRRRGLTSVVTLAHPSGDVTGALRNADIFVLPTEAPRLSADTLQAMGAGVAVVAYPNTICDHLRDGETAVVCRRPAPDALADAIEGLVKDRTEAQAMAKRGMEHVRSHHAVSEEAERSVGVYRDLALARTTLRLRE